MNSVINKLLIIKLIVFIGLAGLLGGSQSLAATITASYSLVQVNGQELPAVSWVSDIDGKHCENLTFGGALLLNLEGRSGAFAMERVNCTDSNGSRSSTINDFVMFTGSYEIDGNQITLHDEISTDTGVLEGDLLTLTVTGVGLYEGQTTEFVFRKF